MVRRLMKNLLLVGAGAAAAILVGVASAQDPAPAANPPAQLDRTFDDNDGVTTEAPTDKAQGATRQQPPADAARGETGQGTGNTADSATGGTGNAGNAGAATTQPDAAENRAEQNAEREAETRSTREDHTNIIMYGPNGLRQGESFPADDEEVTDEGAAVGGAGEGGDDANNARP